jgi:transcriptional regulator with XRE-family HTH domain
MEFHEKLQELRKQKGITQEELASALYVSRTAVSKWESGRGFPNIDSLKALAIYYGVTVDTLLSGDELLTVVKAEQTRTTHSFRDMIYGLLDVSLFLLLFLPLFGQESENAVRAVSLLSLAGAPAYIWWISFALVAVSALWGIFTLALQNIFSPLLSKLKRPVSLSLGLAGVLFFTLTRHPYAALFVLALTVIKVIFLLKRS